MGACRGCRRELVPLGAIDLEQPYVHALGNRRSVCMVLCLRVSYPLFRTILTFLLSFFSITPTITC